MISIETFAAAPRHDRAEAAVRAIFFQSTTGGKALTGRRRDGFFDGWAGVYLRRWPDHTYLARTVPGEYVGYLVGCPDTGAAWPSLSALFYGGDLAAFYPAYPAHFHVNCAPAWRGQGVGGRLVRRFIEDLHAAGISGVHLVTAGDARNRGFYHRLGFAEIASIENAGRALVMLGRRTAENREPA